MNNTRGTYAKYLCIVLMSYMVPLGAMEYNRKTWRPWCGEPSLKNRLIDTQESISIITAEFDKGGDLEHLENVRPTVEQAIRFRAGNEDILLARDRLIVEAKHRPLISVGNRYAPLMSGGRQIPINNPSSLLCSSKNGTYIAALKSLILGYEILLINTRRCTIHELDAPILELPQDAGFSKNGDSFVLRYFFTEYQWDLDSL